MRRSLVIASLAGATTVASFLGFKAFNPPAKAGPEPAVVARAAGTQLPIAQVVLFSSGVGYFQREGEVEGNARVDLVLPRAGHQRPAQEHGPARPRRRPHRRRQLRQPGARREDAPLLRHQPDQQPDLRPDPEPGARREGRSRPAADHDAQPGTMTGVIMGVEKKKRSRRQGRRRSRSSSICGAPRACAAVKMSDVQRVRFLNPVMDSEVKKALETLALSHDTQKKAVSLSFSRRRQASGQGRLRRREPDLEDELSAGAEPEGQAVPAGLGGRREHAGRGLEQRPHGPGFSGRPISFQMDLYQPLFVTRPVVEPELFASLRPPTYRGRWKRTRTWRWMR